MRGAGAAVRAFWMSAIMQLPRGHIGVTLVMICAEAASMSVALLDCLHREMQIPLAILDV
jgi:hypothetical protein